jgi:hypothetical protein
MTQALFFTDPRIVSLESHGTARVRPDLGTGYTRDTAYVPLTLSDIPEAAKSYPIVFLASDAISPVAILGLEHRNYFLDEKGAWLSHDYVPAYVRQYPFVFQQSSPEGELMLSADDPAIDFAGGGEGPLLYEDGKVSAFTQKAFEFCTAFHREYQVTRQLCETLVKLRLITSRQVDTKLGNGRALRLDEIGTVDEAKFKALPAREILKLHEQGLLGIAYYIMQSQSNWRRLLDLAEENEAVAIS